MGQDFQGVYNIYKRNLVLFNPHGKQTGDVFELSDLSSEALENQVGEASCKNLARGNCND